MTEGRIAVAIPASAAAEATPALPLASSPSTATVATMEARLARLVTPVGPEAATVAMGPGLPVPTGAAGAEPGCTRVRIGLLAVTLVAATIPLIAPVSAILEEGTPVPTFERAVGTIPKEATTLRATLDAAGVPTLGRGLRSKAFPVDVVRAVVEMVEAGSIRTPAEARLPDVADSATIAYRALTSGAPKRNPRKT